MRSSNRVLVMIAVAVLGACSSQPPRPPSNQNAAKTAMNEAVRKELDQALGELRAGHDAQAEQQFAAMAQRYPKLAVPHLNLGIIHYKSGDWDKAASSFQRALELNPKSAVACNYLGMVHRQQGRFQDALQDYQAALKLDPDYAYAHLNLGILYDLYLISPDMALQQYQRYDALMPDDKQVRLWIADLKRRLGSNDKAAKGTKP